MFTSRIEHKIIQGTPEWHSLKLGKISSSNLDLIMPNHLLSSKSYKRSRDPYLNKIVAERVLGNKCDSDNWSNFHTNRGNELEPEARQLYELQTGNIVEETGFIELNDYVGCSPDGLVGEDGIIEIKCKDNHKFVEQILKGEEAIEKKYIAQIQSNLFITDRKWCDYVCYNPKFDNPSWIHRINRCEIWIEDIKKEIEKAIQEIKERECRVLGL